MPQNVQVFPALSSEQSAGLSLTYAWDLNDHLDPSKITKSSTRKIWVRCPHHPDHVMEEKALLRIRVINRGNPEYCSICSNRTLLSGFNDLRSRAPHLMREWDWDENKGVDPSEIIYGSAISVSWVCKDGHKWESSPSKRMRGDGCPTCSGHRLEPGFNDLASVYPDIADQWHPTKNGDTTPNDYLSQSNDMVWWQGQCGHEWDTPISQRTAMGHGCPYCRGLRVDDTNSLSALHPELAQQWDWESNEITPDQITPRSKRVVWWMGECGHCWEEHPYNRTVKSYECPVCTGHRVIPGENDLASNCSPELLEEWHPSNELDSLEVTYDSGLGVLWKCRKCHHEWIARIYDRFNGRGCIHCAAQQSTSNGENEVAGFIQSLGLEVERNKRGLLPGNGEIDIWIPSPGTAVEYNGIYWHSDLWKASDYHESKYWQSLDRGINLIQVWEDDWNRKNGIVRSMLRHKLGASDPGGFCSARDTQYVEVGSRASASFLAENHIQGEGSGISRGLALDGEVVAVGVFRRVQGSASSYYLSRYASSRTVRGGMGKILSRFQREHGATEIITFASHDVSDGGAYKSLGFEEAGQIGADYSYYRKSVGYREHKFRYRKNRFKKDPGLKYEEGLTESELAQLNGMLRVYDSGKTRYIKRYK